MMMNTLALLLIVQYMYGCTFWDDNLFNQMAVVGPMCCCMLLSVLIKLYTFCITTLFATHLELMFTHTDNKIIMKIEECWLCAVVRGI